MRWPVVVAVAMLAGCRPAPGDEPSIVPVTAPVTEPVESEPPKPRAGYPAVVRKLVCSYHYDMELCYDEGLVADPALAGRVEVRFVIGPDGNVIEASLTSSELSAAA